MTTIKSKVDITIIPLSEETLPPAIELLKVVFPYDWEDATKNLEESMRRTETNKQYWLACNEQSEIVGIAGLYTLPREDGIVWLGWFGVHPEYRKQGIGSRLLQFSIDEAKRRRCSVIKVYTSIEDNESVIRFYEKFGFKVSTKNTCCDILHLSKKIKEEGII